MTEWKTYKIGDIGKIITGKTPKTAIAENYGGDIPFLTPSDDLSSKFAPQTIKTLTQRGLSEVKNCLLPTNAICVSCIGSDLGKVVRVTIPTVTNQQFNSIIPNEDFDSDFVYYLMTVAGKELNYLSKTSTAVPIVNKTQFSSFEFKAPPLAEQRRIAGILGAIDDKIENNRRINTNLELHAQALYKQWFVDFEFPNEEGKPYKSSGGKMVDSELGPIPEGWSVGKLEDIGDIIGGGTPSKAAAEYYTKNGIAWITPKDLSVSHSKFTAKGETDITELGYKNSSAKIMPRGSVLFSSRAPIGYISIAKNDICTNQGFKSVVPNNGCTAFVYYFLLSNTENIESKATRSTFKEASGALMKSLDLVIPSEDILENFENIMSPIFELQEKFEAENENLATLRDTLLPKLMNEEIKTE